MMMSGRVAAIAALLAVLASLPAPAQAPQAPQPSAAIEADPGVRLTRLIDRAEVRVSRIELQAGATRRAHAHDDVEYHLWIPIEGNLEITIGSDRPVAASAGQAFFMTRGTRHGFQNVGGEPAALFEIFIKQTKTAAGHHPVGPQVSSTVSLLIQ
jgi:quercetin dioxygenase-like cupin family protein